MAVARASIERVTLRHLERDAQGHPEQSRRMTDGELVEQVRARRYSGLRRAGRAPSRCGLSSGAGRAGQRRRCRRHRAGSAGAGLQAHRSVSRRRQRQDLDGLDCVAVVAEPAAADVVEGEQDGTHETVLHALRDVTPSPEARMQSSAIHPRRCRSRFAGCRRNCATRCC